VDIWFTAGSWLGSQSRIAHPGPGFKSRTGKEPHNTQEDLNLSGRSQGLAGHYCIFASCRIHWRSQPESGSLAISNQPAWNQLRRPFGNPIIVWLHHLLGLDEEILPRQRPVVWVDEREVRRDIPEDSLTTPR